MNRIPFVQHRTVNQVRQKYRASRHPVKTVRWHAIWLLARTDEPRTPAKVAGLVGLSDVTVRAVLHRWNAAGPDGVADGRQGHGSDPKLATRGRAGDRAEGRPVRPGPVGRVRRPSDRVAVAAGPRVHSPGPPPQPPPVGRPAGPKAVEKNLRRRVKRLRAANPGKRVEVGAEDEARLGLWPITRRVGWLKGCRPRSGGRARSERLDVSAFARPRTGETFPLIRPRVKVERMADARRALAASADPDGTKILVLAVDRAGCQPAVRAAGRGPPFPAAGPAGVATGRAVLGVGPGGGGERPVGPVGRPPAGGPPPVAAAGRRPSYSQRCHRFHWAVNLEA